MHARIATPQQASSESDWSKINLWPEANYLTHWLAFFENPWPTSRCGGVVRCAAAVAVALGHRHRQLFDCAAHVATHRQSAKCAVWPYSNTRRMLIKVYMEKNYLYINSLFGHKNVIFIRATSCHSTDQRFHWFHWMCLPLCVCVGSVFDSMILDWAERLKIRHTQNDPAEQAEDAAPFDFFFREKTNC